jgi:hypothetical protein
VDVDALLDVASRKAAGETCWKGHDVTIRRLLMDYAGCVVNGHLTVGWYDAEEPFKTRRFCGRIEGIPNLELLRAHGNCAAGRSLFALPKLLKAVGRTRIKCSMDVDQVNCHVVVMAQRHPSAERLAEYIGDRGSKLREVMDLGVSRDKAKELFLRVMYGGSPVKWAKENKAAALPDFVWAFFHELKGLRSLDVAANPDLYEQMQRVSGRPDRRLVTYLNMREERHILDVMAKACCDLAHIGSYEHDGLFVYAARDDALHWKREVLERLRGSVAGVGLEEKRYPALHEILKQLKAKFGGDWDTKEPLDQHHVIARAVRNAQFGREHRLYAQIAVLELHTATGHALKDIFKHQGKGQYSAWCPSTGVWVPDSESGTLKLRIGECLEKRLYGYSFVEEWERFVHTTKRDQAFQMVSDGAVLNKTEELIRPMLEDANFKLDDESARRFLCFENQAYDLDADDFVDLHPGIPSSHKTGWAFNHCDMTDSEYAQLESAMALWLRSETDEDCREEAERVLEQLRFVPDLAFFYDLAGTWEMTLYLLKHMTRAVFALRLQEMLWTRGPGANGKDTLANRMRAFLGDYFCSMPFEVFAAIRNPDAPSEQTCMLRGRRFVAIREVAKDAKIRGHVYKTIADPKGQLRARMLYGRNMEFTPQYLVFFASNVPTSIDDNSKGTVRRTCIVDLPWNFVDNPTAPNEKKARPEIEDQFPSWNQSFFGLLRVMYLTFFRGRECCNVTPVPSEVKESVEEELEEAWVEKLRGWKEIFLETTQSVEEADTAGALRDDFFNYCGRELPKGEVKMKLAAKGFAETKVNFMSGPGFRTTKRVYSVNEPGFSGYVKIKAPRAG